MNRPKLPLYRKHNKRARGFHLNKPGGQFRHERNSKAMHNFEGTHKSIPRTNEGYDYTPLFKFLLTQTGKNWDDVFSEAVSRLDKQEPIFWLVRFNYKIGDRGFVRLGESAYYSKLTVIDGILVIADNNATGPQKSCTCCTYTFNGVSY